MTQEMEKVNDSQCITFDYKYKAPASVPWMRDFQGFYQELHNLLRVKGDATKGVNKVPAPPILRHRSPRTESTISNGTVFRESRPKTITHRDVRERFCSPLSRRWTTLLGLEPGFSDQYEFSSTYVPFDPLLSVRGNQKMSLKLAATEIEARSDSGVNFYPKWGLQNYYPMLSIEIIGSLSSHVDL